MDWSTLAEKFGLPGLMLAAIYAIAKLWIASSERVQLERVKVEDKRADAMVTALTTLGGKVDAQHTANLQSHQEIASGIAGIDSKLDAIHGLTPVRGVPLVEPSAGYYPPQRPKTQGGGR